MRLSIATFGIAALLLGLPATARVPTWPEEGLAKLCAAPSNATWTALTRMAAAHAGDIVAQQVSALAGYHQARQLRDAATGRPEDAQWANTELRSLRVLQDGHLWELLRCTAHQDFDEELMWSALEVAYRLSPVEFAAIATELVPGYHKKVAATVP
jgi:hypothetical protein